MAEYAVDQSVLAELRELARAHPGQASRLVTALEDFLALGTALGTLAAPETEDAPVAVYLVPPRYALLAVPDAAGLVKVDHAARRVTLIHATADYGAAGEVQAWRGMRARARAALA